MQRVTPAEFLSFTVGDEAYGIDIQKVQELRGYAPVTRIANAPAQLKGVVNLRGTIVPIIDLRIRFGLGTPVYDQRTVVVVLNLVDRVIGIVVDSVSEVVAIAQEHIRPSPALAQDARSHVIGIGTVADRLLQLLDPEGLADLEDLENLQACKEATV